MAEAPAVSCFPRNRFRPSELFSRYRLVFQKTGDLIFLSHIDLIRSLERLFRRADLPVRLAGKFHPMPRLIVALALPLGVHGLGEILDVELTDTLDANEILDSLRPQAPEGLRFLDCRQVPPRVSTRVVRLGYRFAIPPEMAPAIGDRIRALPPGGPWTMARSERRATIMASSGLTSIAEDGLEANNLEEWIGGSRPGSSRPARQGRVIDLHGLIESLSLSGHALEAVLRFGEGGSAKPEEILRLIGAEELTAQGEKVERFMLEMAETSGPSAQAPLAGSGPAEGDVS